MDLDLSLARIEEAARVIDPVFLNTPQYADEQLNAALGRKVVVKVEAGSQDPNVSGAYDRCGIGVAPAMPWAESLIR